MDVFWVLFFSWFILTILYYDLYYDTSLFSVIHHVNTSANELNNYLYQINKWAFQWKMRLTSDPNKQVREIIFCRKTKKISHPCYVLITALSRAPHIKTSWHIS